MLHRGLKDPLAAVRVVNQLVSICEDNKLSATLSNDMEDFRRVRIDARGYGPSAMFDSHISGLSGKSFWIKLEDTDGKVLGLQACRLDSVDTSLGEWAVGWMSGLYMKQGQLMVPDDQIKAPASSKAYSVNGQLVYHGELWLHKETRRTPLLGDAFCFLGIVLAYLRWQPDAIWALVSNDMATRGKPTRFGYLRQERSFFKWKVSPEDVPGNEWLLLVEKQDVEHLIQERAENGPIIREG